MSHGEVGLRSYGALVRHQNDWVAMEELAIYLSETSLSKRSILRQVGRFWGRCVDFRIGSRFTELYLAFLLSSDQEAAMSVSRDSKSALAL